MRRREAPGRKGGARNPWGGSRPRRLHVATALALLTLTGCSEVTFVTPTPAPEPTPTLPPIGFNHRYGNSPVAAADGRELERGLYARGEFWEIAIGAEPLLAGFVTVESPDQADMARVQTSSLTVIMASEVLGTIRSFLRFGRPGQLAYCQALLDRLRTKGYHNLSQITMYIYFGESDRHALLTWTQVDGYQFQVFDNDLLGTPINPTPGGGPSSATPPPPTPTPTFFTTFPP